MPSKKLIMIGSTVLVILILVVVIVMFYKKDGYMYPTTTFKAVRPITATTGGAVSNLATGSQNLVSLVADPNGNLSTTANVPIGGIIMWAGSASAVPVNWALCDGTQGTPDLRSRFIVGASTDTSVGQLGSSGMTSFPVGTIGGEEAHALSTPEIPNHAHKTIGELGLETGKGCLSRGSTLYSGGGGDMMGVTGTDCFMTSAIGGDSTNANATVPHNNMPPFFALAFIMKML
jgi:microcystin-dependent protein